MAKNNATSETPLPQGGPNFHPALTSLGRIEEGASVISNDKATIPRRASSFKSLAEILGADNDDEALSP